MLINEIYPAIQGEGFYTGTPMWIIRLQGCDVGCPWCDSKSTWARGTVDTPIDSILLRLSSKPKIKWVMITGGEPCLQDLKQLTLTLWDHGYQTLLETSGVYQIDGSFTHITLSPKHKPPLLSSVQISDEIKMVVENQSDIDRLRTYIAYGKQFVNISLQPKDSLASATDLCYSACIEEGWNLSLQTHKLVGKP